MIGIFTVILSVTVGFGVYLGLCHSRRIDQLEWEIKRLDDLDTVSSIRIANLESYVKELRSAKR